MSTDAMTPDEGISILVDHMRMRDRLAAAILSALTDAERNETVRILAPYLRDLMSGETQRVTEDLADRMNATNAKNSAVAQVVNALLDVWFGGWREAHHGESIERDSAALDDLRSLIGGAMSNLGSEAVDAALDDDEAFREFRREAGEPVGNA